MQPFSPFSAAILTLGYLGIELATGESGAECLGRLTQREDASKDRVYRCWFRPTEKKKKKQEKEKEEQEEEDEEEEEDCSAAWGL
jgi:hypothetical protein